MNIAKTVQLIGVCVPYGLKCQLEMQVLVQI